MLLLLLLCFKFDESGPVLKFHVLRRITPAEFEQLRLAADGIGRAMKNMATGDAAGQLAVNVGVFRIDYIGDAHFGAAFLRTFVDAAGHGDMRVLVDNARSEVFAGAVHHNGIVLYR